MDTVTPDRRSQIMAAIHSKNSAPELAVRRYLHAAGMRYRLHRHDLPGRPDLVFAARRLCVFVHGCFWHGCPHCRHGARAVKSNVVYWSAKLARNKARDAGNQRRLAALGWTTLTIWECEVADQEALGALARTIRKAHPIGRSSARAPAKLASAAEPSPQAAPPPN